MKGFRIVVLSACAVIFAAFAAANILIFSLKDDISGRPYRVEASRIEQLISESKSFDLADYDYITAVEKLDGNNPQAFYSPDSDYLIKEIDGSIYRFDYKFSNDNNAVFFLVNLSLGFMALAIAVILFFVYHKIIRPFNKLCDVPFELSKGNLTTPLKENKSRLFGRFVWGLDLLREKLEQQKRRSFPCKKRRKPLCFLCRTISKHHSA